MLYCNAYACQMNGGKHTAIHAAANEAAAHLARKNDGQTSGFLYGRVLGPTGQPLQHATVKMVSETCEPIRMTKTDIFGCYSFFHVPTNRPGQVIVTAACCGFLRQIPFCLTEREAQALDICLRPDGGVCDGLVTGTVQSQSNVRPIGRAQVVLVAESGGVTRVVSTTQTNEAGQFALTRLPLGSYLVNISAHGHMGQQYRVSITSCGQIANRIVSLCPSSPAWKGAVSGVITDPAQLPVADADVILYRVEGNGATTPIAYTRTNHNGVYLFNNVEMGTYQVRAK